VEKDLPGSIAITGTYMTLTTSKLTKMGRRLEREEENSKKKHKKGKICNMRG